MNIIISVRYINEAIKLFKPINFTRMGAKKLLTKIISMILKTKQTDFPEILLLKGKEIIEKYTIQLSDSSKRFLKNEREEIINFLKDLKDYMLSNPKLTTDDLKYAEMPLCTSDACYFILKIILDKDYSKLSCALFEPGKTISKMKLFTDDEQFLKEVNLEELVNKFTIFNLNTELSIKYHPEKNYFSDIKIENDTLSPYLFSGSNILISETTLRFRPSY